VHESSLDRAEVINGAEVMITAHGVSDVRREEWRGAGFNVADGTCPLVRHAHTQLRALVAAGDLPVVIGQPGHVEVRGLTEDFKGAVAIIEAADIAKLPCANRFGIIAQTTQPIDRVRELVDAISRKFPKAEVRFVDTVCKPTKDRQLALRRLIDEAEVIVVVGGRTSNNTRQLVETCRAGGRHAIHIERAEELRGAGFLGVATVGLTAGTSTLPETVESVHVRLLEFAHHLLRDAQRLTKCKIVFNLSSAVIRIRSAPGSRSRMFVGQRFAF
jgi:4-hydroxy-3-methylbut-2-enyl diphosphate reductase